MCQVTKPISQRTVNVQIKEELAFLYDPVAGGLINNMNNRPDGMKMVTFISAGVILKVPFVTFDEQVRDM